MSSHASVLDYNTSIDSRSFPVNRRRPAKNSYHGQRFPLHHTSTRGLAYNCRSDFLFSENCRPDLMCSILDPNKSRNLKLNRVYDRRHSLENNYSQRSGSPIYCGTNYIEQELRNTGSILSILFEHDKLGLKQINSGNSHRCDKNFSHKGVIEFPRGDGSCLTSEHCKSHSRYSIGTNLLRSGHIKNLPEDYSNLLPYTIQSHEYEQLRSNNHNSKTAFTPLSQEQSYLYHLQKVTNVKFPLAAVRCSTNYRSDKSRKKGSRLRIINVWSDNLEEAFRKIRDWVDKYNYVAIDTEFPGVVASAAEPGCDYRYKNVKCNVDILNMIQLGMTFANENGEYPEEASTWQFNFKFNLETDLYAENAIDLLQNHGIDFRTHQSKGIEIQAFGEHIMSSGLVMCENMKWISFHGCYDFCYFLKALICSPLPESEEQFFEVLPDYFPTFCDIKYLLRDCCNLGHTMSLEKAASHFKIQRYGEQHQAGSDSLVTSQVFFKLKNMQVYGKRRGQPLFSNVLYGLRNGHSR